MQRMRPATPDVAGRDIGCAEDTVIRANADDQNRALANGTVPS
jgi:hypothetical protein